MKVSRVAPLLVVAVALVFACSFVVSAEDSDSDLVSELLHLQSQSRNGVIHLDDRDLRRFLTPHIRSYSVFVFFDALQLHDKPDLHLRELLSEFQIVASSFITNNRDILAQSRVFFCDIEFKESQSSFALFGVNYLPHIRYVGRDIVNLKDSEPMHQSEFARLADAIADFVEAKTRISVGPILRPPVISKKQLLFLAICSIVLAFFSIRKIIAGDTLIHDSRVWMAGAIVVYFFSVSGGMFNIIRKMPMFLADRDDPTRLIFFYQGSGMQLGAEGFAVGFLYTLVGLLLGFVTHLLVKARNRTVQRVFMFLAMAVAFWAVRKVTYLDNWKTGYGVHGFWPSSWN